MGPMVKKEALWRDAKMIAFLLNLSVLKEKEAFSQNILLSLVCIVVLDEVEV